VQSKWGRRNLDIKQKYIMAKNLWWRPTKKDDACIKKLIEIFEIDW
jgi:hypothetical protein